jgi:putative intracellular protease/amidase
MKTIPPRRSVSRPAGRTQWSTALLALSSLLIGLAPFAAPAGAATAPGTQGAPPEKQAGDGSFICPMCYPAHDPKVHKGPGRCPVCGMALVAKSARKNVAILIFDGVQIIDYTGPYEVFGQAHFNVFTVSEKGAPITTSMGMKVTPAYAFANSPDPDILVIPGGDVDGQYANLRVIDWIRRKAGAAQTVMSVCNGAFILARTGLLDGLSATTFYGLIDEFKRFAPKVKVVTDRRFVDNGKFITSAGLSSGIDAALHVVAIVLGQGRAEAVALHMEYDWRPDSGFARAALADRRLPDIDFPEGTRLEPVETRGNREQWQARYKVSGSMSPSEALDYVEGQLAKVAGWKRTGTKGPTAGRRTIWSFTDGAGAWICETYLGAPAGNGGPTLAYSLRRAG